MKGDFSKDTFNAEKHFHDVLLQQGRVLLDTDWNEQTAIEGHRTETGVRDIIGESGAPAENDGFEILPTDDGGEPAIDNTRLKITKGRFYVDGILCENETDLLFTEQPDYPAMLPSTDSSYLAYLDVWQRHITVLEDPAIREVALGGPDTTTRAKTVWQVKLKNIDDGVNCANAELPASPAEPGLMAAMAERPSGTEDPCGLVASGGYRRLENQLYRVEIFQPGNRNTASFTWSRDNGSVQVKWESQNGADVLIVSNTGRDDLLGFKTGQWIELTNDPIELLGKRGILVEIRNVGDRSLTVDAANAVIPADLAGIGITSIDRNAFGSTARIRRWDSQKTIKPNTSNTAWVLLEDGVQVQFSAGEYKAGDYWLIPARTAIADVEWPRDTLNRAVPLPPKGIIHHYAKLAILDYNGSVWSVKSDCRPLFPPLTALNALYYVGGAGQEAMPGAMLPLPLQVGVANYGRDVSGAKVKFEIISGGGSLDLPADGIAITDANGIAQCKWTIGTSTSSLELQVKASLLDDLGNLLPGHLPVLFNESFSIALNVAYDGGDCTNWPGGPPSNVAEALTALCKRTSSGGGKSCSVTVGEGGTFETLKEAFGALRDETDICICLLPGKHKVGQTRFGGDRLESLKITGCGATVVLFDDIFALMAHRITLHGFSTEADDNNPRAHIELSSDDLYVSQCSFTSPDSDAYTSTAFLLLGAFPEARAASNVIHFNDNHVSAGKSGKGIALGLRVRVGGWLENNTIRGSVVLQYADYPEWNVDLQQKTLGMIREGQIRFQGQLIIRANVVFNIMTNISLEVITAGGPSYQSVMVAENVFQQILRESQAGRLNSFVGAFGHVINNQFTSPDGVETVLLGNSGVAIGNIGIGNTHIRLIEIMNRLGIAPPEYNLLPVM